MPATERSLYLTFDDGPIPGPTEFVLETLARFSAKATFFCIGDNVRKHPGVYASILAHNHAVGNHTFHHMTGWKTPLGKYVENVQQCDAILYENSTNLPPRKLFRPPYGRITRSQVKALQPTHTIIMWDVLSVDYNPRLSPEACLRNTIRAGRPGSIIVFHDSVKAEKNLVYALPRLLEHFTAEGYVFKALS